MRVLVLALGMALASPVAAQQVQQQAVTGVVPPLRSLNARS